MDKSKDQELSDLMECFVDLTRKYCMIFPDRKEGIANVIINLASQMRGQITLLTQSQAGLLRNCRCAIIPITKQKEQQEKPPIDRLLKNNVLLTDPERAVKPLTKNRFIEIMEGRADRKKKGDSGEIL